MKGVGVISPLFSPRSKHLPTILLFVVPVVHPENSFPFVLMTTLTTERIDEGSWRWFPPFPHIPKIDSRFSPSLSAFDVPKRHPPFIFANNGKNRRREFEVIFSPFFPYIPKFINIPLSRSYSTFQNTTFGRPLSPDNTGELDEESWGYFPPFVPRLKSSPPSFSWQHWRGKGSTKGVGTISSSFFPPHSSSSSSPSHTLKHHPLSPSWQHW